MEPLGDFLDHRPGELAVKDAAAQCPTGAGPAAFPLEVGTATAVTRAGRAGLAEQEGELHVGEPQLVASIDEMAAAAAGIAGRAGRPQLGRELAVEVP